MALNKDVLGEALYNQSKQWNNKTPDNLGDIETARLNFWKAMASEIIQHIKTYGTLKVPGTGLTSPAGPVGGISLTGTME